MGSVECDIQFPILAHARKEGGNSEEMKDGEQEQSPRIHKCPFMIHYK